MYRIPNPVMAPFEAVVNEWLLEPSYLRAGLGWAMIVTVFAFAWPALMKYRQ